jgi:hypothetical protein
VDGDLCRFDFGDGLKFSADVEQQVFELYAEALFAVACVCVRRRQPLVVVSMASNVSMRSSLVKAWTRGAILRSILLVLSLCQAADADAAAPPVDRV